MWYTILIINSTSIKLQIWYFLKETDEPIVILIEK